MKNTALLKYLLALLLFGSNGIVASLINLTSLQIVLLRTMIGSIMLLALFFFTGGRLTIFRHKKQFLFLAISGMAMGASWMFLYEAYARIGVSISSLFYYCGPVIVMALSPLLFRETLTMYKLAGFLSVLIGVLCINGNAFSGNCDLFGIACGLLSAVMYAFMVICNKIAKDITGLENASLQLFISFLTVAVFLGTTQGFSMEISTQSIVPIFVLGLLNTGIGCYLYFSSIGKLPVQTVAICGYLEPLSAVFFSMIFLRERLLSLQAVGAVLILGGAVFAELAPIKRIRKII